MSASCFWKRVDATGIRFFHVPAGFAKMTKGIGSWGWHTAPQRHMKDRVFRYTQAKVIGGGSAINAQIYTRGNALDYDEWRQMGCEGWGYEDVLPYYRKAEDNDTYNNRYHGQGGPLGVSKPCAPLPICEAYFKAAAELGIPHNEDVTGEKPGRCRLLPADPEERTSFFGGDGLSCPEPEPAEPSRSNRRAGPPNCHREWRCDRH